MAVISNWHWNRALGISFDVDFDGAYGSKNTRAGVIGLERRWKSLKFDGETKERITYTESCAKYVPYCEGCSSFDYVMHLEKNNDLQKAKKDIFFIRISHNNIYKLNINSHFLKFQPCCNINNF